MQSFHIQYLSNHSATRQTNLSALASLRLSASIALCALSSKVLPSMIRKLFGLTMPSANSVGIIVGWRWFLKKSF